MVLQLIQQSRAPSGGYLRVDGSYPWLMAHIAYHQTVDIPSGNLYSALSALVGLSGPSRRLIRLPEVRVTQLEIPGNPGGSQCCFLDACS